MVRYLIAGLVLVVATQAGAQTSISIPLTAPLATTLDQLRDAENQDRVDRGVPETRFCDDDPLVCSQPSSVKFLRARVVELLLSFRVQQARLAGRRIARFCEANPTDQRCIDLGNVTP